MLKNDFVLYFPKVKWIHLTAEVDKSSGTIKNAFASSALSVLAFLASPFKAS